MNRRNRPPLTFDSPCRGLFAGVILLAIVTAGCAPLRFNANVPQLRAQAGNLTRQARQALTSGSNQLAEKLLNRSLQCCPDDPQAMSLLAETEVQNGNYDAAIRTLEKVAKKQPDLPDVRVQLGRVLQANGDHEAARQAAHHAITIAPDCCSAWELLADIQQAEGRPEEALKLLHRAANCPNASSDLQLKIAGIYQAQNRPLRALAAIEQYQSQFRADSCCPRGLLKEGEILVELQQFDRAVERLVIATRRDDATAESFVRLSHAQLAANRPSEARQTIEVARSRWPEMELLDQLASGLNDLQRTPAIASRSRDGQ